MTDRVDLSRFPGLSKYQVEQCRALPERVADLAATFPLLFFMLARNCGPLRHRQEAVRLAEFGKPLADVAAAYGLPLCLRRIPPSACHTPPPWVRWSAGTGRLLADHIPSQPLEAANWLAATFYAARACHEAFGLWIAKQDAIFGEEKFGPAMRATMEDWVSVRYQDMLDMSAEELLQLTVEGLRGEFFGPELLGDLEVSEEDDRYVLAFDPCGTGGRMRRGVPQFGTPARTEPPYSFGLSHEAHDWSWNEKGVCLYCTHCADVNELLPIDRVGRPMRVTEHPRNPGDKCRWYIYKKPELIPEEFYRRVGRRRPDRFVSPEQARREWRAGHTEEGGRE